jgi:hypothetical protein
MRIINGGMIAGIRLPWLRKILAALAVAMPLACFLAVPCFASWPEKRFLVFYLAPILSMAAAWACIKTGTPPPSLICLGLDALVFAGALGRFVIGEALPFSGHMLFFWHALLTTPSRIFRAAAAALILETTWFKLGIWKDYESWGLGSALGLFCGAAYLIAERRAQRVATQSSD